MQVDSIGDWKRSHDCGSLRAEDVGQVATLMGWVNRRRDLGNLIFVDLRDRQGETQIVFDPQVNGESLEKARHLRNEWVLAVKGQVVPRLKGQENPHLPTGAVELKVTDLRILNETEVPPYQVDGAVDASEDQVIQGNLPLLSPRDGQRNLHKVDREQADTQRAHD